MKKNLLYVLSVLILSFLLILRGDSMAPLRLETEKGFLVQHAGEVEENVYSQVFVLNKGTYHFTIEYTASEEGNDIIIHNYEIEKERIPLKATQHTLTYDVTLEEASSQYEIVAHYVGTGYLEIKKIFIEAEQPWYHDNWLNIVGLWLFAISVWIIGWILDKHKMTREDAIEICFVIGTALLASVLFMSGNKVGHGDDLTYHLTRIEGIAMGLREGQFPVMIYPDLLKGNGYLNVMYPSLFLYIPAVLRLMGVSVVTAYKLFLGLINFATAISMYVAMKNMTKSRKAVCLATIMYVFLFYRLYNMFMRAAIGETLAMVFLPLIIAGIYQILFGDKKKWWLLVIGATGVVQSHILSAVMYAVIMAVVVVLFIKELSRERRFCELCKAICLIILLNLWFIVPFMVYYIDGELNLDKLQVNDYWLYSLNPSHLFGMFKIFKNKEFMRDYSLHLPVIILLGVSILYLIIHKGGKDEHSSLLGYLFAIAIVFLFMATNWFPYETLKDIKVLNKIFVFLQFPWRLVGPAAVIIIMIGSAWLVNFTELSKYISTITMILIAISIIDISVWNLPWNSFSNEADADRSVLQDKVCEDVIYCVPEYTVKGNGEYLDNYIVSDDNVIIGQYKKNKISAYIEYISEQDNSWMDIPLQNYFGYRVEDENGERYTITTGDAGNIRVFLYNDGNKHTIKVYYKQNIWFRIAEIISLLTAVISISIPLLDKRKIAPKKLVKFIFRN